MNMNRLRVFGFVACLGFLSGCAETIVKPPITPLPVAPKTACAKYCLHARALKCAEGQPLPNGDSCEKFCEYLKREGYDPQLDCRTAAPTCAVMEKCHLH